MRLPDTPNLEGNPDGLPRMKRGASYTACASCPKFRQAALRVLAVSYLTSFYGWEIVVLGVQTTPVAGPHDHASGMGFHARRNVVGP